jgi:GT2 family glycosyltransferase
MPVRYVRENRRGKGYAYNCGMATAAGEVLLFTDDDIRPPADWIEAMCGPIMRGETDAVAGGVNVAPHLERPWLTGFLRVWVACTNGIDPKNPDQMYGANMAFSRRVLEKVPAFDCDLGPGALGFFDDTLFAWQLLAAGFRIKAALDVVVEHHFDADRLSAESFVSIARRMGRSRAYVDHHWLHEPVRFARLQCVRYALDVAVWRLTHPAEALASTPPSPHRMYALYRLELARHSLLERKRPRHYARRGLRRLQSAASEYAQAATADVTPALCVDGAAR